MPTYAALLLAALLAGGVAQALTPEDSTGRPPRLFAATMLRQGNLLSPPETLLKDDYTALDLKLGWQTDDHDKNLFDAMYRYPSYGVGYYMGNMNGIMLGTDTASTSLGKPAALYAFFGAPMYRSRRVVLSYGFSAGLSYNFNVYSTEKNPFNILIGSKANAYIELALGASLLLPGRSALTAGVSFQHFSNGSYQKPNLGVNLISGTLAYQLGWYKNDEKSYAPLTLPAWTKSFEWDIVLGGGVRMLDADFDPKYPHNGRRWACVTVSTALLRQASLRRKWGGGVDLLYYEWGSYVSDYRTTFNELTAKNGVLPAPAEVRQAMKPHDKLSAKNFTVGLYAAHEASYKRISMITNVGFYPFSRVGDNPSTPIMYERLGVRVALTDRLFVGVSIRAHKLKADYTEWSVGYALARRRDS